MDWGHDIIFALFDADTVIFTSSIDKSSPVKELRDRP